MSGPVEVCRSLGQGALSVLLLVSLPAGGASQETEGPSPVEWRNTTEVSFLMTGGNSAASTLGLRHALRREDASGELRLDLTALRTDATRITRIAVGTSPEDFRVEEDEDRERTAERYSVEARYDRDLTSSVFVSGGVGWTRNTLAGFNHRVVLFTGAGSQWEEPDSWTVKVGYGLTYTVQRDVTPDPERSDTFAGLRLTLDSEHELGSSAALEVKWVADGNARELSDVRGDFTQSVTASLTDRLSMKTTLQLLVDNDPPLESLSLRTPAGDDTGQSVAVPLGKVDHSLSVALVITL